MGREIRRVPKNWKHPKDANGRYKPLLDMVYELAAEKWKDNFLKWENGKTPEREESSCRYYWEWAGSPPDKKFYRPLWKPEEVTCYQIYENISEGTPVSPVFETTQEMEDWILKHWHISPKAAKKFIELGYAPSLVLKPGSKPKTGYEALDDEEKNR